MSGWSSSPVLVTPFQSGLPLFSHLQAYSINLFLLIFLSCSVLFLSSSDDIISIDLSLNLLILSSAKSNLVLNLSSEIIHFDYYFLTPEFYFMF